MVDILGNDSSLSYQFGEVENPLVADPVVSYLDENALKKAIEKSEKDMFKAAKNLEFMEAARLRDELDFFKQKLKQLS